MSATSPDAEASGWAVLAALRFFLALVVVLGHCCWFVGGMDDWTLIGLWLNQGSAVFGFFILSGYSIAASLERSQAGFYRRRFIRIWPLYLTCIGIGLVISWYLPHGLSWPTGRFQPPGTAAEAIASFLMLQTILAFPIPVIGQIWSLSPEWWHYMLAPWLRTLPTWVLLAFVAFSFEAFMGIPTPPGSGPEGFTHGLSFLTLSWLWVTGFVYRRLSRRPGGIALLTIPSVLALYFGHFTGLPLFITIFVLSLSAEFTLPGRCWGACNWLGDVSFPLYLFHMPVIAMLAMSGVRATAPMVVAAVLAAVFALYAVDYPARAMFRSGHFFEKCSEKNLWPD